MLIAQQATFKLIKLFITVTVAKKSFRNVILRKLTNVQK